MRQFNSWVLLGMLALLQHVTATNIIHPKPGLYIEKLGHTQVSRGTLRMQMNLSFTEMTEDAQHLMTIGSDLAWLFKRWETLHSQPPSEQEQYDSLFDATRRFYNFNPRTIVPGEASLERC